jgi:hypothetical protein
MPAPGTCAAGAGFRRINRIRLIMFRPMGEKMETQGFV